MQKANEDCFYFLTSSCSKGNSCPYRHNPSAITSNVICTAWLRGMCVDSMCSLRHSNVQRPNASNGILCFYENTPAGCLRPDCTFAHSRSRVNVRNTNNVRPSTTNLVNKEMVKTPLPTPAPNPVEMVPKVEKSVNGETVAVPSPAPVPAPAPVPVPEPVPEKVEVPPVRNVVKTNSTPAVSTTNNNTNDVKQRAVINRNVVVATTETTSSSTTRSTSNRVVVTAESVKPTTKPKIDNDDDSDIDLDELIEQENDVKKTNANIDILFPCSAPSITNRSFLSSKASTPTPTTNNDTKPVRLNRERLPTSKSSSDFSSSNNNSNVVTNDKKTPSAGTPLSDNDERRNNRLERFKTKPNSPPRTVVNAGSTRDVIVSTSSSSSSNDRKRPASDQTSSNDSPPSKRLSQHDDNQHYNSTNTTIGDLCSPPSNSHRMHTRVSHRRLSPSPSPPPPPSSSSSSSSRPSLPHSGPIYPSKSAMKDSDWKSEVDKFLARTTQPKKSLPTSIVAPQPFHQQPRPIAPALMSMPSPRQPVPRPRPVVTAPPPKQQPVVSPPPVIEKKAPVVTPPAPAPAPAPALAPAPAPTSKPAPEPIPIPTPTTFVDDESSLLDSDEQADVVETFALIDDALFEADNLLDLI